MLFAFTILALILIYFSWRSLRGGLDYLDHFAEQLQSLPPDNLPFATLVIPCKGLDHGLEKNLSSFLSQDYEAYQMIFVVDDRHDPAVSMIQRLIDDDQLHENIKLVISQKATTSGQKVENLRQAILHADDRSEVFVFADSDARVSPDWLTNLISPLSDASIGATTGYRWFITENGGLAGELRSVWNASIASTLGPNRKRNFCWGGSMAIRREVFEKLDVRERWNGTLSDDFTVTRLMRENGLGIHFVPQALAASIENCTFGELLEFTNRQMKITRVYSQDLWIMSFVGSGLFCTVMTAAIVLILLSPIGSYGFVSAAVTLLLVSLFSIGKSWLRLSAIRMAMPEHSKLLKRQWFPQITLCAVAQPLYFVNCIAALFSKKIVWRGITYELKSCSETIVVREPI